ncbi:MAG: hypothetical protein GAK36_00291 [Pseudomonas sp.]|nr:MAG: hypothetical protein GAK36_00291 [Pseudomonas sp.]
MPSHERQGNAVRKGKFRSGNRQGCIRPLWHRHARPLAVFGFFLNICSKNKQCVENIENNTSEIIKKSFINQ